MKRYFLTGPAEEDLREIWSYLFDRAGPDRAARVVEEFGRAMERLSETPGLGHQREELGNDALRVYRAIRISSSISPALSRWRSFV